MAFWQTGVWFPGAGTGRGKFGLLSTDGVVSRRGDCPDPSALSARRHRGAGSAIRDVGLSAWQARFIATPTFLSDRGIGEGLFGQDPLPVGPACRPTCDHVSAQVLSLRLIHHLARTTRHGLRRTFWPRAGRPVPVSRLCPSWPFTLCPLALKYPPRPTLHRVSERDIGRARWPHPAGGGLWPPGWRSIWTVNGMLFDPRNNCGARYARGFWVRHGARDWPGRCAPDIRRSGQAYNWTGFRGLGPEEALQRLQKSLWTEKASTP